MKRRWAMVALGLLLGACGDAEKVKGGSAAGGSAAGGSAAGGGAGAAGQGGAGSDQGGAGGEAANRAPAWAEAPAAVTVREGESTRVTFAPSDPDGDTIEVTLQDGDGWRARIEEDQLVIEARFDGGEGSTLVVGLDDGRGGKGQAQIAVTVQRRAWGASTNLVTAGIEAREHPALFYDDSRERFVVLGGSGYKPYGTPLGDLYQVARASGAVKPIEAKGDVPPPGASRRLVLRPDQKAAYLFGGYGASDTSELYRVDYAGEALTFTRLEQSKGPKARSLHLFAHDPKTQKFFVFGGVVQIGAIFDDLWSGTLSGNTMTWTQHKPQGPRPTPRYGFFYGVDEQRGLAYVYSGAEGFDPVAPARDLWQLDLRSEPPAWTKLLEGDAVPPGRRNGAFAYDSARHLFYVWGGTPDAKNTEPGLWVYDARSGVDAWFKLDRAGEPPMRSSGAGVIGPDGSLWVGFGNTTKAVYADLTPLAFAPLQRPPGCLPRTS